MGNGVRRRRLLGQRGQRGIEDRGQLFFKFRVREDVEVVVADGLQHFAPDFLRFHADFVDLLQPRDERRRPLFQIEPIDVNRLVLRKVSPIVLERDQIEPLDVRIGREEVDRVELAAVKRGVS